MLSNCLQGWEDAMSSISTGSRKEGERVKILPTRQSELSDYEKWRTQAPAEYSHRDTHTHIHTVSVQLWESEDSLNYVALWWDVSSKMLHMLSIHSYNWLSTYYSTYLENYLKHFNSDDQYEWERESSVGDCKCEDSHTLQTTCELAKGEVSETITLMENL